MINSKNISNSLGSNLTNNSNKNEYKSIRNIFTKPKKNHHSFPYQELSQTNKIYLA